MNKADIIDEMLVKSWVDAKLDPVSVEAQLKQMGFSESAIHDYLKAFRKERYAGRRFNGFLLAGVGALLGFISCMLSIFNPFPELYNLILFGLTSVAIILICWGLYFLFE